MLRAALQLDGRSEGESPHAVRHHGPRATVVLESPPARTAPPRCLTKPLLSRFDATCTERALGGEEPAPGPRLGIGSHDRAMERTNYGPTTDQDSRTQRTSAVNHGHQRQVVHARDLWRPDLGVKESRVQISPARQVSDLVAELFSCKGLYSSTDCSHRCSHHHGNTSLNRSAASK
jgi:hypothetical protein